MNRRLAVAGVAIALDLALGEPPDRWHPVAWLGRGIAFAEGWLPQETGRQRRCSGLVLAAGFIGGGALVGFATQRVLKRWPGALALVAEAVLLKQSFAVRALFEHATTVERLLREGNLDSARRAASRMVSRRTDDLPPDLLASAAIESLAENTSDSIVAPLQWYAVFGLPGAFAYRAANTLDATVGYRTKGSFGTPSARLDDALNIVAARLTAGMIAVASGKPRCVAFGLARDASTTPSPNAGWPMAAAAYALGTRLEKRGHHVLNAGGRAPSAMDIARTRALVGRALALSAIAATAGTAFAGWWWR